MIFFLGILFISEKSGISDHTRLKTDSGENSPVTFHVTELIPKVSELSKTYFYLKLKKKHLTRNARLIYNFHERWNCLVVLPQHKGVLRTARQRFNSQCFDASKLWGKSESSCVGGVIRLAMFDVSHMCSRSFLGTHGQQLLRSQQPDTSV